MFFELVGNLLDGDINDKHRSIIGMRKILSNGDSPPIHLLFDCNIFNCIIEIFKQSMFPQMKLEASWILTNVAAGTPNHVSVLIEANTIPVFIQLLLEN